jgi:hypothetical protein
MSPAVDRALADLARAMGAMDAELEGGVGGSVRRRSATIEVDDDDDDDVGGKVARGMGDDDDDDGSDRPSDDTASVANDDEVEDNYEDATDYDDIDYDYDIGIDGRIDVNDNDDDDDYGEEDAQIIIIGGWLGVGPYAADDMWVLDISGGLERLRWFRPVSFLLVPGRNAVTPRRCETYEEFYFHLDRCLRIISFALIRL